MKATGIVRRIDELGRVVIPKEIRRTLRIREGDPLEIFTDKDGVIILKKYSPIGELSENAQELAFSLHQTFSLAAAICDKDTFVSCAGLGRRDITGKAVSEQIEHAIASRSRIIVTEAGEKRYCLVAEEDPAYICSSLIAIPIVSQSDSIGAVLLFSQKPDVPIDTSAIKACETVSVFLGKQMDQ
ncbi:MAG: stage V sporulation T C-terminal domain-containing protein [Clostridia bacterium]